MVARKLGYLILLSLFWLSMPLHAEVEVRFGFGRVTIEAADQSLLGDEQREQLATQLLIDEDIASYVLKNEQQSIVFKEDEWKSLNKQEYLQAIKQRMMEEAEAGNLMADKSPQQVRQLPDRVVVGSTMVVNEDEHIKKLVVLGGEVDIYGRVDRLTIIGGTVRLRAGGVVGQQLRTIGGKFIREQGSRVEDQTSDNGKSPDGNWQFDFDNEFEIDEFSDFYQYEWLGNDRHYWWGKFFGLSLLLVYWLVTLMIRAFFPIFVMEVYQQVQRGLVFNFFVGMLSLVFIPVISVFMVLTLIGIPLLPVFLSFLFIFYGIGFVMAGHWLWSAIFNHLPSVRKIESPLVPLTPWSLLLGGLTLELISHVPWVGSGLSWLLSMVGFGAVIAILTRLGRPLWQKQVA